MELIKAESLNGNALSVIDVAGSGGGKWRIVRVIRVVETDGAYIGLNRSNVICEHYRATYDARSKKQRLSAISEALAAFDEAKKDQK